jgi:hypothetical protein
LIAISAYLNIVAVRIHIIKLNLYCFSQYIALGIYVFFLATPVTISQIYAVWIRGCHGIFLCRLFIVPFFFFFFIFNHPMLEGHWMLAAFGR